MSAETTQLIKEILDVNGNPIIILEYVSVTRTKKIKVMSGECTSSDEVSELFDVGGDVEFVEQERPAPFVIYYTPTIRPHRLGCTMVNRHDTGVYYSRAQHAKAFVAGVSMESKEMTVSRSEFVQLFDLLSQKASSGQDSKLSQIHAQLKSKRKIRFRIHVNTTQG